MNTFSITDLEWEQSAVLILLIGFSNFYALIIPQASVNKIVHCLILQIAPTFFKRSIQYSMEYNTIFFI